MISGNLVTDVVANAQGSELIPPSSNRVRLIIFPPSAGGVTLHTDTINVYGQGIVLTPGMTRLELTLATHGDIIQKGWNAFYLTPNQAGISWISVVA